jgi:hypothetical protein
MRRVVVWLLLAFLAAAAPAQAEPRVEPPPSAKEFARIFVGVTTAYALGAEQPERIARVRCVQAVPGYYMCSYTLTRPGRPPECHLMQARWTPLALSTITVTLAGRTTRCGSVREAIASLR